MESILERDRLSYRTISQGKPFVSAEVEAAAIDALRNDRFVGGENVAKFEEEFANFIGTKYAVALSSGTAALDFIFMALGIGAGDRVVTSTWSFIASANSIMHAGGQPVFADINDEDYCIDPSQVKTHLEVGARGILPVHIYGHPVDFDAIRELGERFSVPIVEDAAQAHGSRYKGRHVGTLGVAGAFSFYPSKNMTVLGDGGMVTTNDETILGKVLKLRDSGRTSQYEHDVLGYTARLNTVNAAIGRVQLRHLEEWNERRKAIADSYFVALQDIVPQISLPPRPTAIREPVFNQFVIRTVSRDGLRKYLGERGIQTNIHYPIPIHLQPFYVKTFGFTKGVCPRSELLARECLSLPMHPFLSNDDVRYICDAIRAFFAKGAP